MEFLLLTIVFGNLVAMTFKSYRSVLGIVAPALVMSLSLFIVLVAPFSFLAILIAIHINLSLFVFSIFVIVRVLKFKTKDLIDEDVEYWEGYANDKIAVRCRVLTSRITKMFVWQRDKGRCVACNSNQNLEFNYITPISEGGSNTDLNIQLLCELCKG